MLGVPELASTVPPDASSPFNDATDVGERSHPEPTKGVGCVPAILGMAALTAGGAAIANQYSADKLPDHGAATRPADAGDEVAGTGLFSDRVAAPKGPRIYKPVVAGHADQVANRGNGDRSFP